MAVADEIGLGVSVGVLLGVTVAVSVGPSAMFTIVRISSTVTILSPAQSPTHGFGVGVLVGVAVGVTVMVGVGAVWHVAPLHPPLQVQVFVAVHEPCEPHPPIPEQSGVLHAGPVYPVPVQLHVFSATQVPPC